ncbi:MerR family transcriptional regulator [Streptomyces sp. NPDC050418]|uniref:MerR family transcriptional regulator n=1 Tax=Streptomyces sp. NPDC050418 TaxID=3365612 RepID=UPI0037A7AD3F
MDVTIGEVAHRTGVTERTLRYYEELGLLAPARDGAGRRLYGAEQIDRLYRIRLLRALGTPVAEIDPDGTDLLTLTSRHLADLDHRIAGLARQRERVRTVEERLMGGQAPADEELLGVLTALADPDAAVTRRLTLLVYRDIEAAQRHLVDVFGFAPGELTRDDAGAVVHGEVYAGDGLIWMHRESAGHGLASPATLGGASHCMAVHVDDVEAHCTRVREAGGRIVYEPTDMPYGVREYGARDTEGGLWSFMQPLHTEEER